jgi:hypothetical protein
MRSGTTTGSTRRLLIQSSLTFQMAVTPRKHGLTASYFPTCSTDRAPHSFPNFSNKIVLDGQRHRRNRSEKGTKMITNEVQHRNTKAWLTRFESSTAELESLYPLAGRTRMQQLQIDASLAQAADLRSEFSEYEAMRSGNIRVFESQTLSGLAEALVKGARSMCSEPR